MEVGEGSFWGNFTFLHCSICEQEEGLVGIASKNSFVGRYVCLSFNAGCGLNDLEKFDVQDFTFQSRNSDKLCSILFILNPSLQIYGMLDCFVKWSRSFELVNLS